MPNVWMPATNARSQLLDGVPKKDIYIAQTYMAFSCIVALACCAWTLHDYMDDSITMRAYSYIGSIASGMLLAGLIVEWLVYRRGGCFAMFGLKEGTPVVESARKIGLGVTLVHIATASICIFSVCAAAVNIYENSSPGLYGLSCTVIAFYWLYIVFYTPNTIMHIAVHRQLPEAEQLTVTLQVNAISLVWRKTKMNPLDYM